MDSLAVLVCYASRMGSTREIAEAIATELADAGLAVTLQPCSADHSPAGVDAVIIGSAIYTRRWDKSARSYLKRHRSELAKRPVWLFHSGPCGPGAESEQVAATGAIRRLAAGIGAAPPTTFGGRLDAAHAAGPVSRWMAREGPLSGDFRDWTRIRDWAREIAADLAAHHPATGAVR